MRYYKVTGAVVVVVVLVASIAAIGSDKHDSGINPAVIEAKCKSAADSEPSVFRGSGKTTKMWCAVVDREGQTLAINATDTDGTPSNPAGSDAWRGSIEIALAKAYSAVAFSSNDQALNTFSLGLASRPDAPGVNPSDVGHDDGPAPLWGIGNSNPYRPLTGKGADRDDALSKYHHGIITFAGGEPVYDCTSHQLLGAVGVSGDGVDEDDAVATAAVTTAGYCLSPHPA
jgi:uncharacterized protein GlcG (DUF336 family)